MMAHFLIYEKQEDTTMKEMYFTIAGCNHYYGSNFMEKGMKGKPVIVEEDKVNDENQSGLKI